jgi:hypothetical protein
LFKGEKNTGKTSVAHNTVENFLKEDSNNRAVYVGFSKKSSVKAFTQIDAKL